jgi:hypothetical protein
MSGMLWVHVMSAFNVCLKYRSGSMSLRLLQICWNIRKSAVAMVNTKGGTHKRGEKVALGIAELVNEFRVIGDHAQGEMLMGQVTQNGNGVHNVMTAWRVLILVLEGKYQWTVPTPWGFVQDVTLKEYKRPVDEQGEELSGSPVKGEGKQWRDQFVTRLRFRGELPKATREFVDKVMDLLRTKPIKCAMVLNQMVNALKEMKMRETQEEAEEGIVEIVQRFQKNEQSFGMSYQAVVVGKMPRCEHHTVDEQSNQLSLWTQHRMAMISAPISPVVTVVAMMMPVKEVDFTVMRVI